MLLNPKCHVPEWHIRQAMPFWHLATGARRFSNTRGAQVIWKELEFQGLNLCGLNNVPA
jgi:hypothetical protein